VVHQPPTLEGVPAELRPLIERCLAKEPGDRPTAGDLLAELANVQSGARWLPERITTALAQSSPSAAARAAPGNASGGPAHERTATSAAPPNGTSVPRRPPLLRRRMLLTVALAGAVLAVAAGALAATLSGSGRPGALKGGGPTKPASSLAATHHPTTPAASTTGHPPSKSATPKRTQAGPPKPTATRAAVGPVCSFVVGGATTCDSTNSLVRLYVNFANDTSSCSFARYITWGDGTSSEVFLQGGPAGPKFAASHTYLASGTYTIYFGGEVTQGFCIIRTPTFLFELLPR